MLNQYTRGIKLKFLIFICIFSSVYLWNRKTAPAWDGGGSIFFLQNQNVMCGVNEALRGFHLIRPSGNTIAYEFQCEWNTALDFTGFYTAWTGWQDTAPNQFQSVGYLDRHVVQCNND